MLLWLSLIIMTPFDLQLIESTEKKLVDQILNIGKPYLQSSGKEREGAAVLIARLLGRKDTCGELGGYIEWCYETWNADNSDVFLKTGILNSLCEIHEKGDRKYVQNIQPQMREIMARVDSDDLVKNNILVRKLRVKLVCRIGLSILKPRTARWRYTQKNRSLLKNLGQAVTDEEQLDEEYFEIDGKIEEIVGYLLDALKDKDTIVRWSAAKGIARITTRLPKDFADQVVSALLDLFAENNGKQSIASTSDATWHGSCLAVAELCRNGLILPPRIPDFLPYLQVALLFDIRRGAHSIGSHVRDAACYVIWSLVRTYPVEILSPFTHFLTSNLIIVSCFDREINVRRAASAAYQEGTGRQGNFPEGIAIIGIMDYFAVGTRKSAFSVGMEIATREEYKKDIIKHLQERVIRHWDRDMRELGAECFGKLSIFDVQSAKKILLEMISNTEVMDSTRLHGVILSISHIIDHFPETKMEESLQLYLPGIIGRLPERIWRSSDADILNEATCQLIVSLCSKPLKLVCEPLLNRIKAAFISSSISVHKKACQATMTVFTTFQIPDAIDDFVKRIDSKASITSRRGFTKALGAICFLNYEAKLEGVLFALQRSIDELVTYDTDTRANAISAIDSIFHNSFVFLKNALAASSFQSILRSVLRGLEDYTTDSRGDIGSIVRQASICTLTTCLRLSMGTSWLSDDLAQSIYSGILKQSVEKIDRVRQLASEKFIEILKMDELVFKPRDRELFGQLLQIDNSVGFPQDFWSSSEFFLAMLKSLQVPNYRISILSGFVTSAGAGSESLLRVTSTALISFTSQLSLTSNCHILTLLEFLESLIQMITENFETDRIMIPALVVIGNLFELQILQKVDGHYNFGHLFDLIHQATLKSRNVSKLAASIRVYSGLATLHKDKAGYNAILKLTNLLLHPFPRIRSLAADNLFVYTSSQNVISQHLVEECETVLLECDWSTNIKDLKTQVVVLRPLLLEIFRGAHD
ncbi:Tubulin-specific chaperone D [Neolecta irregularis DAH-3]|uniref:Tubulin-specific chaperone D n=1 Tax=Neolecta irregularis (strain DAH-3) TaxID=1198029 RepID=A0A1U7LNW5_NEOID|nr:Tubulin-specific chaperone D [Neolecta irregularis DAH-3]|eukprot:OLL24356.1 Tubulin-specific chaperone D [Neolecta irregularis DAH-3]